MKNIIVSIIALLAYANASASSTCSKIEGTWSMPQYLVTEKLNIDVVLSITEDTVTATSYCTSNNVTTQSAVTVKSSYTDFALSIHETKQNKDAECTASLEAGIMSYTMVGNFLMLNLPSGVQLFLIKN